MLETAFAFRSNGGKWRIRIAVILYALLHGLFCITQATLYITGIEDERRNGVGLVSKLISAFNRGLPILHPWPKLK